MSVLIHVLQCVFDSSSFILPLGTFIYIYIYTVKPVLRGHLWDTEKVAL
jgi:hypothetical protein